MRSPRLLPLAAALAVLSVPTLAPAIAQMGAAPSAAPSADPLKTAFERLADADRRAVQTALIWTGNYTGVVSGGYGPRTRDALTAFAKSARLPPESILDAPSRQRLLAAAAKAQTAVGFAPVHDPRAGLMLGLPLKIVDHRTTTDTGTRYASADGAVVVDTLSRPAGGGGLGDLFDRMSAETPTRAVTYKLLKPDFFVVTGKTGQRRFYSRYVLGSADPSTPTIRGFTLAYPDSDAARMDPITIAVAASFDPFLKPGSPPPASPAALAPAAGTSAPRGEATTRPSTIAAFALAPGAVLALIPPASCPNPRVGGGPVQVRATDEGRGFMLLATPDRGIAAVALADAPASEGMLFSLFPRDGGLDIAPATLRDGGTAASTSLQGDAAVVIDRAGALVAVVPKRAEAVPSVQGTRLAADYRIVDGSVLRAFLDRAGVTVSLPMAEPTPKALGDIASTWRARLVAVDCQATAATP